MEVQVDGFRVSYNVAQFKQDDVGVYTVTVCSSVGCASSSVNLTGSGIKGLLLHFLSVQNAYFYSSDSFASMSVF